jgi:hypothetical protein
MGKEKSNMDEVLNVKFLPAMVGFSSKAIVLPVRQTWIEPSLVVELVLQCSKPDPVDLVQGLGYRFCPSFRLILFFL